MPRTAETTSFKFNHTMIRVKDPQASLKFYEDVLGMELISKSEFSDFTLYFLGYDHSDGKATAEEKTSGRFAREGVLELTHNHGTETDSNFQGYASGNTEPGKGFGHIAIAVDDVEKACERFEKLGVNFKKRPSDGKMRHIAFILDPDGYWIEIVPSNLNLSS
ncbi:Glyoxalase/Bleomycin resistance protein/Dihydroxybiphenyl dioxygenase [Rhizoctonia solani]|nr:Glyoxalase/Bleomycin resistance protein/Dihydroxybiphenyl dioxygenase [Rhizoctonia solani]